jgi:hypothetical protein
MAFGIGVQNCFFIFPGFSGIESFDIFIVFSITSTWPELLFRISYSQVASGSGPFHHFHVAHIELAN